MEQPPAEPANPKPRKRMPKATFTSAEPPSAAAGAAPPTAPPPRAAPPPAAAGAAPTGGAAPDAARSPAAKPRPRRAKAAPAVLFQPPAIDSNSATGSGSDLPTGPRSSEPATPPPARKAPAKSAPAKAATGAKAAKAPATPKPPKTATPTGSTRRKSAPAVPPVTEPPVTEPVVTEPVVTASVPASEVGTDSGPQGASARIGMEAGPAITVRYAPELLALAAVARRGPAAAGWARRLRVDYPAATPDALARLATRRYVRLAGVGGAVSVAAGLLAPVAELAAVAFSQVDLVLRVAAAYGRDPVAPERAVELLVLTRVYPNEPAARAALDAAAKAGPGDELPALRWVGAPGGGTAVARAGGWVAMRLAARLLPGAGLVAAAVVDSAATQRLAARAVARYRVTAS